MPFRKALQTLLSALIVTVLLAGLSVSAQESSSLRVGMNAPVVLEPALHTNDPETALTRAIYDYLGLSFPERTRQRMESFLGANRRENRPLHDYTLDHFGLSETQIERDFSAYRQRHILPRRARAQRTR